MVSCFAQNQISPPILGIWYLVFGTWYLVLGTWYLVLGTWYLVLGGKQFTLSVPGEPQSPDKANYQIPKTRRLAMAEVGAPWCRRSRVLTRIQ
jgi:hypothetical protein